MTLGDVALKVPVRVMHVGGERAFRRRLMELGLVPGTVVEVIRVAPLGDPVELRVRGCELSIRKSEARSVTVASLSPSEEAVSPAESISLRSGLPASS
jgi:Fe2+ transport system protein FeoA